jgi:hypothetical protein
MGEPDPVAVAAAATGVATSATGSLVMVIVADPSLTAAPLTDWRVEPVTKYTVEPAVIDGEVMVTVTAGNVPVTFVPLTKKPIPKVTTEAAPPGGVTEDVDASVTTNWTGPVKAPAGTVAKTVVPPSVALAVPPLGWIVASAGSEGCRRGDEHGSHHEESDADGAHS